MKYKTVTCYVKRTTSPSKDVWLAGVVKEVPFGETTITLNDAEWVVGVTQNGNVGVATHKSFLTRSKLHEIPNTIVPLNVETAVTVTFGTDLSDYDFKHSQIKVYLDGVLKNSVPMNLHSLYVMLEYPDGSNLNDAAVRQYAVEAATLWDRLADKIFIMFNRPGTYLSGMINLINTLKGVLPTTQFVPCIDLTTLLTGNPYLDTTGWTNLASYCSQLVAFTNVTEIGLNSGSFVTNYGLNNSNWYSGDAGSLSNNWATFEANLDRLLKTVKYWWFPHSVPGDATSAARNLAIDQKVMVHLPLLSFVDTDSLGNPTNVGSNYSATWSTSIYMEQNILPDHDIVPMIFADGGSSGWTFAGVQQAVQMLESEFIASARPCIVKISSPTTFISDTHSILDGLTGQMMYDSKSDLSVLRVGGEGERKELIMPWSELYAANVATWDSVIAHGIANSTFDGHIVTVIQSRANGGQTVDSAMLDHFSSTYAIPVIGGLKTCWYLMNNPETVTGPSMADCDFTKLSGSDLRGALGWQGIATSVSDFITRTGQRIIALDNVLAQTNILNGGTFDAALFRTCLQALPKGVTYIWHPGSPGSDPSKIANLTRMLDIVQQELPSVIFSGWFVGNELYSYFQTEFGSQPHVSRWELARFNERQISTTNGIFTYVSSNYWDGDQIATPLSYFNAPICTPYGDAQSDPTQYTDASDAIAGTVPYSAWEGMDCPWAIRNVEVFPTALSADDISRRYGATQEFSTEWTSEIAFAAGSGGLLAHHLAFTTQPVNTQVGQVLVPVVSIQDINNNTVTGDDRLITLTLISGTLFGTASLTTVNGVATWTAVQSLNVHLSGAGYRLRASHSGLPFIGSDTVDSSTFNITSAAAHHLVFSREPADQYVSLPLLPEISIHDEYENTVPNDDRNISLALLNANGAVLHGTTNIDTSGGVATWTAGQNLNITQVGSGYALRASHGGGVFDEVIVWARTENVLAHNYQPWPYGTDWLANLIAESPGAGITFAVSPGSMLVSTERSKYIDARTGLLNAGFVAVPVVSCITSGYATDEYASWFSLGHWTTIANNIEPYLIDQNAATDKRIIINFEFEGETFENYGLGIGDMTRTHGGPGYPRGPLAPKPGGGYYTDYADLQIAMAPLVNKLLAYPGVQVWVWTGGYNPESFRGYGNSHGHPEAPDDWLGNSYTPTRVLLDAGITVTAIGEGTYVTYRYGIGGSVYDDGWSNWTAEKALAAGGSGYTYTWHPGFRAGPLRNFNQFQDIAAHSENIPAFAEFFSWIKNWKRVKTDWADVSVDTDDDNNLKCPYHASPHTAYDKNRHRTVLFGDNGYTWEWNGNTDSWQVFTTGNPGARTSAGMAFDINRSKTVLFGGYSNGYRNDTWERDASGVWLHKSPGGIITSRSGFAFAYDLVRNVCVLFGGYDGNNVLTDTYIYDGLNWSRLTPAHHPPARTDCRMAFDPISKKIILFGGSYGGTYYTDTWAWNGSDWAQISPAHVPTGRIWHTMSTDTFRGVLVMYGGMNDSSGIRIWANETWEWNGSDWLLQSNATGAIPWQTVSISFDSDRNEMVMIGSSHQYEFFKTKWWNSGGWTGYYGTNFLGSDTVNSTTFNISAGSSTAHHLRFTVQPVNTVAGVALVPNVRIEDVSNNVVTDDDREITLSLLNGAGLFGTANLTTVSGVAQWTGAQGLNIHQDGTGYALRAAHNGVSFSGSDTVDSNTFNITSAAAHHLVFSTQPVNQSAGTALLPTVTIKDAYENTVTSDDRTISLTLLNANGATLNGTTILLSVNGVATWTGSQNLNIHEAATGYALRASHNGAVFGGTDTVDSDPFNIIGAIAHHLTFTGQPEDCVAGSSITPAVTIRDQYNNTVTNDDRTISLTLLNSGGATLNGTTILLSVNGVATWTGSQNLNITQQGVGYALRAGHSGTAFSGSDTVDSDPFAITIGVAHHLAFTAQPNTRRAGSYLTPAVAIKDASDNTILGDDRTITLELLNANGATLLGTVNLSTVGGVAQWTSNQTLNIHEAGVGYALRASHSGLSFTGIDTVDSNDFSIVPRTSDHLSFTTQPIASIAGAPLLPVVRIQDQYNNTVTDDTRTITLSLLEGGGATLYGETSVQTADGIATWSPTQNLHLRVVGTGYELRAVHSGPSFYAIPQGDDVVLMAISDTVDSNPFSVIPATADHMTFNVEPTNQIAGAALTPVVIIKDLYDNTVTADIRTITLGLLRSGGGQNPAIYGTVSLLTVNGVATWTGTQNVNIHEVGTAYWLRASHDGASFGTTDIVDSIQFSILHAPSHHMIFSRQPFSQHSGVALRPEITICDAYENTVENDDRTISLTLLSGNGASLSGTTSLMSIDGVSTWTETQSLNVTQIGSGYQLRATHAGAAFLGSDAVNSTTFDIGGLPDTFIPERVFYVYNQNVTGSQEVADYYRIQRGVPTQNVMGFNIPPGGTGLLSDGYTCEAPITKAEYITAIETPLLAALTAFLPERPFAIILGYGVPLAYTEDDGQIIAIASRVSRIGHPYSAKLPNPTFNRQDWHRFNSTDASQVFITAVLDGPSPDAVQTMIDRNVALSALDQLQGKVYVDPYSINNTPEDQLYQDAVVAWTQQAADQLGLDTISTEPSNDPYQEVTIYRLSNDCFYWGRGPSTFSRDLIDDQSESRVFLYNADGESACNIHYSHDGSPFNPDGSDHWCNLAINVDPGYAACAGAVDTPGADVFLYPSPFFYSLLQGATMGEAYLFAMPALDWKTIFIGDPLTTVRFPSGQVNPLASGQYPSHASLYDSKTSIEDALAWGMRQARLLAGALRSVTESSEISEKINLVYALNAWHENKKTPAQFDLLLPSVLAWYRYFTNSTTGTLIEWLDRYGYKLSEYFVMALQKSGAILDGLTESHLYPRGSWTYRLVYNHQYQTLEPVFFEIQVTDTPDFSNILFTLDSSADIEGWMFEAEPFTYIGVAESGVSSNYSGRHIEYNAVPSKYLPRTEIFYVRWRAKDGSGNRLYPTGQEWSVDQNTIIIAR